MKILVMALFASVLQTYTKQFRYKFVRVPFFSQDDFIDLKKPSDNYVYMCFFVFVSGTNRPTRLLLYFYAGGIDVNISIVLTFISLRGS